MARIEGERMKERALKLCLHASGQQPRILVLLPLDTCLLYLLPPRMQVLPKAQGSQV